MSKVKKNITVSIASIASREKSLEIVIKSLINQVDFLNIYLNDYKITPEYLKNNSKISIMKSESNKDLGDIGKFYWVENIKGYHFTCDDDIIYPDNYINYMIDKLKEHNGFISCHGAIFENPFISFYKSKKTFHFQDNLKRDTNVNLLGTGLLAYDADNIKIPLSIFKYKNMADVFIAIYAKDNNIPCVVVEHKSGFIKDYYIENASKLYVIRKIQKFFNRFYPKNIYYKYKNNDVIQTSLINNNAPWNLK